MLLTTHPISREEATGWGCADVVPVPLEAQDLLVAVGRELGSSG